MNVKKRRLLQVLAGILAVLLIGVVVFWDDIELLGNKHAYFYTYKTFYELVEEGRVDSAVIKEKEICFTLKDDSLEAGEKPFVYKVENPSSPTLKEHLLLNGVKVTEEKSGEQIFSNIMDVFFYLVFFGAVLVLIKKVVAPNSFKVVRKTGKKFDDVVGMDSLKKDFGQIMDIMHNPAEWKKKGLRMPKGVILEGAPGNGKTLFAKALAGEASVNFIPTKATDFESMLMAIGPMKVKMLFKKARRMAPCIVFIDEFDGIGTRRNYSGSAIETENTRIVTALLNELDGFKDTDGVLVLAATNSISALDEALIRPGRFDARVTVPYPDEKTRVELVKMYTKGKALDSSVKPEDLARKFNGYSCAKIESVLNEAGLTAVREGNGTISMSHVQKAVEKLQ